MKSLALGVPVAVLTAFVFAVPLQSSYQASAPPPTLTREVFSGTISNLSGTCNGGNATMSFDSSGVATGPYGGTYSAHVTLSSAFTGSHFEEGFNAPFATAIVNYAVAEVTTFTETFEIRNPAGDLLVSGTKRQLSSGYFRCADVFSETNIVGTITGLPGVFRGLLETSLSYEATIFTPSGTYHDQGSSPLVAEVIELPGIFIALSYNAFSESFASSLPTPSRGVPTTRDNCSHDGWRDRTRADGTPFRNQGDCVQYVETGR